MPKATLPVLILSLVLMFSCLNLGSLLKVANAQLQRSWCIANPTSTSAELLSNLDFACSKVDCSVIQQGSSCFYPNTVFHHASFAMNLYYQSMARHISDCDFRNSGLISFTDPSTLICSYDSGGPVAEDQTPIGNWCVAKPATNDRILQENIDFACNHVDCSPIQDGGSCFSPTTLMNHAAFAMNLYYQSMGRSNSSCDFDNSGLVVAKSPSYGACSFQNN